MYAIRSYYDGVVNQVNEFDMLITLNCDELPEWTYGRKLGVQLLFDENSYKEMEKGLKILLSNEDKRLGQLIEVILGNQEASFNELPQTAVAHLNENQNKALQTVLASKDVAIIHGPPGTGKTTTLIESIVATLMTENQLLVCAPSNAAVDLVVEKLSDYGVSVVRLGHPARVTKTVMENTMDRITSYNVCYTKLLRFCPHCKSSEKVRWGKRQGIQRYKCKACKKTYNSLSGTPLARLRKKELWLEYASCLVNGVSIRKAAALCSVSYNFV